MTALLYTGIGLLIFAAGFTAGFLSGRWDSTPLPHPFKDES